MIIKWGDERIRVPEEFLALGMRDESFRNDTSPSVGIGDGKEDGVMVQVFISGEEAREMGLARFHCWVHGVEPEAWLDTNSVAEAAAFVRGVCAVLGIQVNWRLMRNR